MAQPNSGILKKNEHGPEVAVIAAIFTTETSYAARTLCQESWWLKEPCHCGQTLRLPENKQRQAWKLQWRQVVMTFLLGQELRLATRQAFISVQAPSVLQGASGGPCLCQMGLVPLPPPTSTECHFYVWMMSDNVRMVWTAHGAHSGRGG